MVNVLCNTTGEYNEAFSATVQ